MIRIKLESQEEQVTTLFSSISIPKKVSAEIEEPSHNLLNPNIDIFFKIFVKALFAIGYTRKDINAGFKNYLKNIKHF